MQCRNMFLYYIMMNRIRNISECVKVLRAYLLMMKILKIQKQDQCPECWMPGLKQ